MVKNLLVLLCLVVPILSCFIEIIEAQTCYAGEPLKGKAPPEGVKCNEENNSECCVEGKFYDTYSCSPPVGPAMLTLNDFGKGGDGGGPSECDGSYHPNERVVALSTGWFKGRCSKNIVIEANGRTVTAKVVDECDSTMGCDEEHAYQRPCPNNVVDGSPAVWEALGIPEEQRGELNIVWYEA